LAGLHPDPDPGRDLDNRVGDTSVTCAVPQPQAHIVSLRWKVHKWIGGSSVVSQKHAASVHTFV